MTAYIYCLIDPETQMVRWIGTTLDPKKRLAQHWYLSGHVSNELRTWITTLKKKGTRPKMTIIEEVSTDQRFIREQYWMDMYRRIHPNTLLNKYAVPVYAPGSWKYGNSGISR